MKFSHFCGQKCTKPSSKIVIKKNTCKNPSLYSDFAISCPMHNTLYILKKLTLNCTWVYVLLPQSCYISFSTFFLSLLGISYQFSHKTLVPFFILCHIHLINGAVKHRLFGLCPPLPTAYPLVLSPHPPSSSFISLACPAVSRWSSTSSRRGTLGGHKGLTAGTQI